MIELGCYVRIHGNSLTWLVLEFDTTGGVLLQSGQSGRRRWEPKRNLERVWGW